MRLDRYTARVRPFGTHSTSNMPAKSALYILLALNALSAACGADGKKSSGALERTDASITVVDGAAGEVGAPRDAAAPSIDGGDAQSTGGLDASPDQPRCTATREPAPMLSQTGCFDPTTGEAVEGLLPYRVNAALWSDAAAKQRFLALPAEGEIVIAADGDFEFPLGTVLIKSFERSGRKLETRLLMKVAEDEWLGVSYAWRQDQRDALLLTDSTWLELGDGTWRVPSRDECFTCHTEAAGITLGLTAAQLDGDFTHVPGGEPANQLEAWAARGVFGTAFVRKDWASIVDYENAALPIEQRARAYLASNCSHCHREGGSGLGASDYRPELSFSEMGICNERGLGSDLGIEGARLLVPGQPEKSTLWLRMGGEGPFRMPPLGTQRVDEAGQAIVGEWIRSLTACP